MKILLVDDDAFLRDMYELKFTEAGFTVVTAKSGEEAVRIIKEQDDIDVMLLDMVMPGLSGIELLEATQQLALEHPPKYIVLSNQSDASEIEQAKQLGAIGYIIKAEMIPSDVVKEVEKLMSK